MGRYYETFDPPFFMERRYAFDTTAFNAKAYSRAERDILADLTRRLHGMNIDTTGVQMTCSDQVIELQGSVASPMIAQFLEKVADRILGTRGVTNRLEIQRAGASTQTLNPQNLDNSTKQQAPDLIPEINQGAGVVL